MLRPDAALRRILLEPRNALLRQYQAMVAMEDATLEFTDEAIDEIVTRARKLNVGARGLRTIVEQVMIDVMYDAPELAGKHITITRDMIIARADLPVSNEKTA